MSRALPGGMAAAINASGAQPTLVATLTDPRCVPSLFASSGTQDNATRVDVCLDASGTILETLVAQTNPATVQIRRITSPATAAQWTGAATNVAAGAIGSAGARIFSNGVTCRLVYQRSADLFPVYRDSTDVGVTWGAETVLGPGSLPLALGNFIDDFAWDRSSIDTIWVICRSWANTLQGASGMARTVRVAGVWGAWTFQGPLTSTWGQMRRVSSIATPAGQLYFAGMMRRNTLSGFGAAFFTRAAGAFNSAPLFLQDMDNPALGLSYSWSAADGNAVNGYYAAVTLVDDGSVSGNAHRVTTVYFAPAASAPAQSWQILCSLSSSATPAFGFGVCLDIAAGLLFLAGKTQVWTIPIPPVTAPTDLSPNVLSLHVTERPSQPTRAKLILGGQGGLFAGQTVTIALGYNGSSVSCWKLIVEDCRNLVAGDQFQCELDLIDTGSFSLSRISQRFMALSSYTVSQLVSFIAQLANLTVTVPATSPMSQVVPCFVIKPGESPLDALGRLVALYELNWQTRADGSLLLVDAQVGDPNTWSYGQEALALSYGTVVDQPNVIRVIGDSPLHAAEVTDDTSIQATGVSVARLVVDRLITTAAAALIRAQQVLRQEQIHAAHAQLTVTVNPQLELSDVVQVTDPRLALAAQPFRIESIDTIADFHSGSWAQHLELANP